MWLVQNAMAKPDNAGAASTDYMHLFGLVALGYMWAQMAKAAQAKLAEGGDGARRSTRTSCDRPLLHGAHDAGDGCAPGPHSTGADTLMALPAEAF